MDSAEETIQSMFLLQSCLSIRALDFAVTCLVLVKTDILISWICQVLYISLHLHTGNWTRNE